MTKPKAKKQRINYKGWSVSLIKGVLTVVKNGYKREYQVEYPNNGLEHKRGSEYFYVRCNTFYYQFKFEENDFFVGDKFDNQDEFIGEFASYVFEY